MTHCLFACRGGVVCLPTVDAVLVDRADGGNLVVNPPREVWERCELSSEELRLWGCLVAATGHAMLASLPQLADGCVNYWEAGNWALNDAAPPLGRKRAREHRSVHLHVLGRSPDAVSPNWAWGEAPIFPMYLERKGWAAAHRRLTPDETLAIARAIDQILRSKYGFAGDAIEPSSVCQSCAYPFALAHRAASTRCAECAA